MEAGESPSRQLTIFFIAVMLIFSFFLLFAYFFLGQSQRARFARPGSTWRGEEDDVELREKARPGKERLKTLKDLDRGLAAVRRGKYIPRTRAERQYFAAMDKARKKENRLLKRRKRQEKLSAFLESPLGQNLTATFELARRGRSEAAKRFIGKLLQDLVEMDLEVQRFVIQSALSVYHHDKDKEGLSKMMVRYLDLSKEHGAANADNQQLNNWINRIERHLGSLQKGGGNE